MCILTYCVAVLIYGTMCVIMVMFSISVFTSAYVFCLYHLSSINPLIVLFPVTDDSELAGITLSP